MHASLDFGVARVDSRPVHDIAALEDYLGEEVMDGEGNSVGTFACYWEREEKKALLLGVVIPGHSGTHVVPARGARLSERRTYVQVAFGRDRIIQAPCLACECEIDDAFEQRIWAFYGLPVPGSEAVDLLSQKVEAIQRQLRRIKPPDAAPATCGTPRAASAPESELHPPAPAVESPAAPAVPQPPAHASPPEQNGRSNQGQSLEKE